MSPHYDAETTRIARTAYASSAVFVAGLGASLGLHLVQNEHNAASQTSAGYERCIDIINGLGTTDLPADELTPQELSDCGGSRSDRGAQAGYSFTLKGSVVLATDVTLRLPSAATLQQAANHEREIHGAGERSTPISLTLIGAALGPLLLWDVKQSYRKNQRRLLRNQSEA